MPHRNGDGAVVGNDGLSKNEMSFMLGIHFCTRRAALSNVNCPARFWISINRERGRKTGLRVIFLGSGDRKRLAALLKFDAGQDNVSISRPTGAILGK